MSESGGRCVWDWAFLSGTAKFNLVYVLPPFLSISGFVRVGPKPFCRQGFA